MNNLNSLTNGDLVNIWKGLYLLRGLQGFKFNYAIERNRELLKREIKAMDEATKPSEAIQEYTRKRLDLCRENALKDEKGQPLVIDQNFDIDPKKREVFDQAIENLRAEYGDAIKEQDAKDKEFENFLKAPADFDFYFISHDSVPDNIKNEQMEVIFPMLAPEPEGQIH